MPNHEETTPNLARLSPVQQAEMNLILAGKWPALKPLPVFKYEAQSYRASIEFDKTHGEWVCRKTSFASNNVQELHGSLAELARALPHHQIAVLTETVAPEQHEQELEKDASRRLQAFDEWRQNYRNGALYCELREFLSESQQKEIDDCVRLSLTARQLQFHPKNISYVFDALAKAGGRLATLIEIAQRKAQREANVAESPAVFPPESTECSAPEPTEALIPALAEALPPIPIAGLIPSSPVQSPERPINDLFTAQSRTSPPQPTAPLASPASPIATLGIPRARSQPFIEAFEEHARYHTSVSGLRRPVRTGKAASPEDRTEHWTSRLPVLEISGFQLSALAVAILFAAVSLAVSLSLRHNPSRTHSQNARNSKPNDAKPNLAAQLTPPLDRPGGASSPVTPPPALAAPAARPPTPQFAQPTPSNRQPPESIPGSTDLARVPASSTSFPQIESQLSEGSQVNPNPWFDTSPESMARNAPSTASDLTLSPKPRKGSLGISAPRNIQPVSRAMLRPSRPAAILVTPAYGGKPFRVSFPEKTITANSSFAMSSLLSVVVSPQRGPAAAHLPARLQAAELVSFAWPRYPTSSIQYGFAELIKVRASVGRLGTVTDIKLVSGSPSLLPATISAIRQWRFKPALLNKRPIQAQEDITIEFRPPQYLSHLTTQRLSPN